MPCLQLSDGLRVWRTPTIDLMTTRLFLRLPVFVSTSPLSAHYEGAVLALEGPGRILLTTVPDDSATLFITSLWTVS